MITNILAALFYIEWQWATIDLFGKETLHGQIRRVGPVFQIRSFGEDELMHRSDIPVNGGGIFRIQYQEEYEVRLAFVKKHVIHSWDQACSEWRASWVIADLCAKCAKTRQAHEQRVTRQARFECALDVIAAVTETSRARVAIGTDDSGESESWYGDGKIQAISVQGDKDASRRCLTEDEWTRVRAQGISVGEWKTEGDKDPDDDIPF